jgi:hypothetical protein
MPIEIGARVQTRDGHHAGEIHRVVIDLIDQAVTGMVAVGAGVGT